MEAEKHEAEEDEEREEREEEERNKKWIEEREERERKVEQILRKWNPKDVKTSTEPKRGISSYNYFCNEMRPVVKEQIPDIASHEILKELGRRWILLSDEDKNSYYERLKRK
jgi:hypothetical protein